MDQNTKLQVVANMKTFGGSFVQALAECIIRADHINSKKIEDAFSNYIDQYHPDNWGK